MTVFRTRVDVIHGQYVQTGLLDTISWQGKLWLVRRWQQAKTEGNRQPVRIIRPQLFQFERPVMPLAGEDYYLACAIPNAILDGQAASEGPIAFDIVEAPPIEIPIPKLQ
jgi:hypothetical protein